MPTTVETRMRVRYAETDAAGVAYHSNYFVWFEAGRSEYFRLTVGASPAEFFQHYGMPVTEAAARYVAPCRYDDPIVVATRITDLRSRLLRFEYDLRHDESGATLATGQTTHVCVDHEGKPCRIPAWLLAALRE